MRAEITFSHGQAKLLPPIYLKPDAPSHYPIEVPDNAVINTRDWFPREFQHAFTPSTPMALLGSLQERFNPILGVLAKTRLGRALAMITKRGREALFWPLNSYKNADAQLVSTLLISGYTDCAWALLPLCSEGVGNREELNHLRN